MSGVQVPAGPPIKVPTLVVGIFIGWSRLGLERPSPVGSGRPKPVRVVSSDFNFKSRGQGQVQNWLANACEVLGI